jgi:hypothetical protein
MTGRQPRIFLLLMAMVVSQIGLLIPAQAQDRALIIGVGAFADERLAATGPVSVDGDIATMEKLLTGRLGFAKEEIKILRDAQATKSAILDAITGWLRPDWEAVEERRADEEKIRSGKLNKSQVRALRRKWRKAARGPKRSYVYYAGPGHFRRDLNGEEHDRYDETLVPYDAQVVGLGDSIAIDGMITDDEFSAALAELDGRDVTVVLDSSHSGWVTRSVEKREKPPHAGRALAVPDAYRTLALFTPAAGQKVEGGFVETSFEEGSLAVWSAVSASQTALVDTGGETPVGVFTRLFAEGLADNKADANDNGFISNTELLVYIADGALAYCIRAGESCALGLTPRLDPVGAYGLPAAPSKHKRRWKLSMALLADHLVKNGGDGIVIRQEPPSPVEVGDARIRFTVTPPRDGRLILLSLTDAGQLIQLYPNQLTIHSGGWVAGNVPVVIPDSDYGLQLTATDPAKGHVVAVFTSDPVDFGKNVYSRPLGDVPRSEALKDYLPRLSAALASPLNAKSVQRNARMADWSVATLPFEIVAASKAKKESGEKPTREARH